MISDGQSSLAVRAAAQFGEAETRSDSSRKKGVALEDAAAKESR